ncbi:MAG: PIN domain-containing protein [Mesorhizobium sp.]|nr:PIN domain-containing protein [Mesorhizobium sp.]
MKLAVDTNIFVYAEGVNGPVEAASARKLIADLPVNDTVVPVQVLGELFNVLTRKGQFSPQKAAAVVTDWSAAFRTVDTSSAQLLAGLELAEQHRLNIWDAIILSVSASAGCRLLLSEDMQNGFEWRGVTVVDPFLPQPHPLLARALAR